MLSLIFLCLSWYVLSQNEVTIPLTNNPVQTTATLSLDLQNAASMKTMSYGYLSGLGIGVFGGQSYGPADPTSAKRLRVMSREGTMLANHAGVRYGRHLSFSQLAPPASSCGGAPATT